MNHLKVFPSTRCGGRPDALRIVFMALMLCLVAFAGRAAADDELRSKTRAAMLELDNTIRLHPSDAGAYHERGVLHFKLGEMAESVRDFDRVIELAPRRKPEYWQRGISLYYAGRYEEGRKQFELHRTVNPDDVENAAWHYLCVAKTQGPAEARKLLIPIHGDARIPMMMILALYAGQASSDDVLREAAQGSPPPDELRSRLFYAHLYLGLFAAANGDPAAEREHIRKAALDFSQSHYMGDVARVHWAMLTARDAGPGMDHPPGLR